MVYCVVFGCKRSTSKNRTTKVSFHKFPENAHLKGQWIEKINGEGFKPTQYSHVCGKHFKEEDFVISRAAAKRIGYNQLGKVDLRPGVVPTQKMQGELNDEQGNNKHLALEKRHNMKVRGHLDPSYRMFTLRKACSTENSFW